MLGPIALALAFPARAPGQAPGRPTTQASPAVIQGQGQARAPRTPSRYEVALIQALQANPTTSPYLFATELKGNKVVLHGRVGTKTVHDVAIQSAIALGVPVVDALVIDTAAAHDAAAWQQYQQQQQQSGFGYGGGSGTGLAGAGYGQQFAPPSVGPGLGSKGYAGTGGAAASLENQAGSNVSSPGAGYGGGTGYGSGYGYGGGALPGSGTYGSLPYTYPPPLFGRLDDPFFGFEPPPISYPPWWNAMTARRLGLAAYPMPLGALSNAMPAANSPASTAANGPGFDPNQGQGQPIDPQGQGQAAPVTIPYGTIEMVIDGRGSATLRGTVPTVAERIAIGQQMAKTPGVSQVVNLLSVGPAPSQGQGQGQAQSDNPPPPPMPDRPAGQVPQPATRPAAPTPPADAPPAAEAETASQQRAARAVASRGGPAARVKVRDGVASLTGKVPTVFEAMQAYRAAQQTPGVREVDDRLEFVVPDGSGPNPLADKGRPEDVEPYLEAQIRRQVGDLAHIDRVRVQGDNLDIKGTLARAEDRNRFDAILRSMAILRGFRLNADVPIEAP